MSNGLEEVPGETLVCVQNIVNARCLGTLRDEPERKARPDREPSLAPLRQSALVFYISGVPPSLDVPRSQGKLGG